MKTKQERIDDENAWREKFEADMEKQSIKDEVKMRAHLDRQMREFIQTRIDQKEYRAKNVWPQQIQAILDEEELEK